MSTAARLYRSLLKAARPYDVHSWRRGHLLGQSVLNPFTASSSLIQASNSKELGHMLYFMQPSNQTKETINIVKKQFRYAATRTTKQNAPKALNRGFEILRALRSGLELPSNSNPLQSMSHPLASQGSTTSQTASFTPSSSGIVSRAASTATASPLISHHRSSHIALTANSSHSSASHSLSSSSSSSGPALRRVPAVRPHSYGAHSSILGRLHHDAVDLQKPPTPNPIEPRTPEEVELNQDSKYGDAVFQLTIYGEEYLKLISPNLTARSTNRSTTPNPSVASIASSVSNETLCESGNELHLIDASRMRHQQSHWLASVCGPLAQSQRAELEQLIQKLGVAVEANAHQDVIAFQANLSSVDKTLAHALLANNQILDAWANFLYANKRFNQLIALFKLRLSHGVDIQSFAVSRSTLCKVMVSCAIEGDVTTSMMALRESSWASLATSIMNEPSPMHESELHNLRSTALPSSVNRLPSWVPSYYYSNPIDLTVQRSTFEAENGPDPVLAAAADGFGIETSENTAPVSTSSTVVMPSHPRVSVTNHVRPLSYRPSSSLSSFSSFLGSSLLHPPTPTALSQASMSSFARSRPPKVAPIQVPTATVAEPPAASTPIPIIDLWTELSLDSRLMELAIIAATRSESRKAEFESRSADMRVKARAAAHPVAQHPDLNLSIHEHAQAIEQLFAKGKQQPNSTKPAKISNGPINVAGSIEGGIAPPSLFASMNNPRNLSPLAFQLWSIMLKQQIPLQHSHSYVSLVNNLALHMPTMSTLSQSRSRLSNLILQTLSSEFHHARQSGSLKYKTLRSDLEQFVNRELALNQQLATVDEEGGDNLWQALTILRQIQIESLKPNISVIAQIYSNICNSADGVGRTKLLQNITTLINDLNLPKEEITRMTGQPLH